MSSLHASLGTRCTELSVANKANKNVHATLYWPKELRWQSRCDYDSQEQLHLPHGELQFPLGTKPAYDFVSHLSSTAEEPGMELELQFESHYSIAGWTQGPFIQFSTNIFF